MDIMNQSKSSSSQKRAALLKKGLLRSTADELEVFAEIHEDIDGLLMKLEKISPSLLTIMKPAVEEIKQSIQYATSTGFNGPIYLRPLMWATHHVHFNDGLRLEVVRRTRRQDVLAAAGRSVLHPLIHLQITYKLAQIRQIDSSVLRCQNEERPNLCVRRSNSL